MNMIIAIIVTSFFHVVKVITIIIIIITPTINIVNVIFADSAISLKRPI